MFLFLRLVLAHFIGDFLLQTNKIFALKHRGLLGGVPHALIITASLLALSWPYLGLAQIWFFIILMGLLHLLQDSIKISQEGLTKHSFWLYLLDQCSHIVLIATLFFTGLKDLSAPLAENRFVSMYNNDLLIVYLIAIIAVTYNGFYLISNFRLSFMPSTNQYADIEKWFGMLERALIVTFCIFPKAYLILLILLLLRFFLFVWDKKRPIARHSLIEPTEIVLSWGIGLTAGVLLIWINYVLMNTVTTL